MRFKGLIALVFFLVAVSCTVKYSFTGASISQDVKTYTIYDFVDRVRQNPNLSDYITEQLKDKFTRQTSLSYVNDGGNLEFEGTITGYNVKPISVQSGDVAAQNRLTVQVSVKFTNNKDHDQDFESSFSAYYDFDSENNLSDIEDTAVEEIVKQIISDVYNKSVANW